MEPAQGGRYLHRHTVLHQGSSSRLYPWQKNNPVGCSRAMVGGELEAEGDVFENGEALGRVKLFTCHLAKRICG